MENLDMMLPHGGAPQLVRYPSLEAENLESSGRRRVKMVLQRNPSSHSPTDLRLFSFSLCDPILQAFGNPSEEDFPAPFVHEFL
ncbi:hypothetical protein SDJN02_03799, partial [Cucurbita argyrosperma subsp. argyrosperma]